MLKSLFVGGLLICAGTLVGTEVRAADMAPLFPQQEDPDFGPAPRYTFGNGWYLRGDIGWGETTQAQISADIPIPTGKHNWDGDLGVGYRWSPNFRTDLTVGAQEGRHIAAKGSQVICPYQLQGVQSQDATPVLLGYAWSTQTGTCNGQERGFEDQAEVMANGYFDLGTWYGLTPYIGAGAGAAWVQGNGDVAYYKTSDGSLYAPNLSPTGQFPLAWVSPTTGVALNPQPTIPGTTTAVPFAQQNWKSTVHRTRYNFAWSVMAGLAYAVDNHITIDLGYRYLNVGNFKSLPGPGGLPGVNKALTTQEVRVGVRYVID